MQRQSRVVPRCQSPRCCAGDVPAAGMGLCVAEIRKHRQCSTKSRAATTARPLRSASSNSGRCRIFFAARSNPAAGRPEFVFYEGPPTANGKPGIHHVLARTFKDLVPALQDHAGLSLPRKAGWDTHGLPVEHEVEKALGIFDKRRIEREVGVARFVELCRASVMRYVADWEAMTTRMGFWVDLDDAYLTLQNDYIESVWNLLKKAVGWRVDLSRLQGRSVRSAHRGDAVLARGRARLSGCRGSFGIRALPPDWRGDDLVFGLDHDALDIAGQSVAGSEPLRWSTSGSSAAVKR
jgi:hypothetical protein